MSAAADLEVTAATPVGPDVAVGLSQDFEAEVVDVLPLETVFEVEVALTHNSVIDAGDQLINRLRTEEAVMEGFKMLAHYERLGQSGRAA